MIESTSHAARASRGVVAAPAETHPSGDDRFAVIDKHLKRTKYAQDQLIETLHIAQDVFGYLDDDVLMYVARSLRLPPSMVLGTATFYELFTFEQPGEHTFTVCTGTACYVKRADEIVAQATARYGVMPGETTADGVLTLKTARCIGSCSLAPMVLLDGVVVGNETPENVMTLLEELVADPVLTGAEGGDA
jgi:bidirectional [NiFe] hydrogenase diaphorase subunit